MPLNRRLGVALDVGRVATWDWDISSNIAVWSDTHYTLLGHEPGAVEPTYETWLERVHPDDRDRINAAFARSIEEHKPFEGEYRLVLPDGRLRWITSKGRTEYSEDGRPLSMVGALVDITERKLAELALAKREAELSIIFGQALVGICYRNSEGRLINANARYTEILGRSLDELAELDWRELVHPDDLALINDALATEPIADPPVADIRYRRGDGTEIWCRTQWSYVRGEDGAPEAVVVVLDDITPQKIAEAEQRQLQERLAHVTRYMTAGALGSTLAHELQQPHAAIVNYLGAIDLLIKKGGSTDTIGSAVSAALAASARAGEIVRRMREFVAQGRPRTSPEPIGSMIDEVCGLLAVAGLRRDRLRVECADPAIRVDVDRIQIQQVLTNLIKNALEASGTAEVVVTAGVADGCALVTVEDSGPGIPAAVAENLFQLFSSSKRDGLGLGLCIARTIVEAHRGTIAFANRPTGGAQFVITLPLA